MTHSPAFTPEATARRRSHHAPRGVVKPWAPEETELAIGQREDGETYEAIGRLLGRTVWSVKNHVNEVIRKRAAVTGPRDPFIRDAKPHPGVPRCSCGLALPCNSCLPGVVAYASARRGVDFG